MRRSQSKAIYIQLLIKILMPDADVEKSHRFNSNIDVSRESIPSDSMLLDKLLFLREEIAKLKAHIENRKAIAFSKSQAIKKEIEQLSFDLEECSRIRLQPGVNPSFDSWRNERERRILSLKQLLWELPEQVEHDLLLLERELRELLREYLPLKRLIYAP
jgi:hypothetical protein